MAYGLLGSGPDAGPIRRPKAFADRPQPMGLLGGGPDTQEPYQDPQSLINQRNAVQSEDVTGGRPLTIGGGLLSLANGINKRLRTDQLTGQIGRQQAANAATNRDIASAYDGMIGGGSPAPRPLGLLGGGPSSVAPAWSDGQSPSVALSGMKVGITPQGPVSHPVGLLGGGPAPQPAGGMVQTPPNTGDNGMVHQPIPTGDAMATDPLAGQNDYLGQQRKVAMIMMKSANPEMQAKGLEQRQGLASQMSSAGQAMLRKQLEMAGLDVEAKRADIGKTQAEATKAGYEKMGYGDQLIDLRNGKPIAGGSNLGGIDIGNVPPGQAGLDAIRQQNPGLANDLSGWVSGRVAFPQRLIGSPMGQQMMAIIQQIDPHWTPSTAEARAKFTTDLASSHPGTSGFLRQTLNTALEHMGALSDSAEALGNSWSPTYNNWIKNTYKTQTDDPTLNDFNSKKQLAMAELGKLVNGGAMTQSEIQELEANISASSGPKQLRAAIGAMADLLQGKLSSMDNQYKETMGQSADPKFQFMSPEASTRLGTIRKRAAGADATSPTQAQSPAEGAKQAPDGKWYLPDPDRPGKYLMVQP